MSELASHNFLNELGYNHISYSTEIAIKRVEMIRSGELVPLYTSLNKEREEIGGIWPGELSVTAGRTGCGKTAKALSDIHDYINPDINPHYYKSLIILYDNWELPDWRNILRFISRDTGQTVKSLLDKKKLENDEKFEQLKSFANKYKATPIYFHSVSQKVLDWYKEKRKVLQVAVKEKKTVLILVDHTRLVTKSTEKSEEALITNLLLHAMLLKNEFPYTVIFEFISQLNRNIEQNVVDRTQIGNRTPIASDIFGSDAVFQFADIVKALHRPGMYGLIKFNDYPTGRDENDPDKEDYLLLLCILKQREGKVTNLLLKHNLAINKIKDYV